jgi:hypothetical protein
MTEILIIIVVISAVGAAYMAYSRSGRNEKIKFWKQLAERFELTMNKPRDPYDLVLSGEYRGMDCKAWLGGGHAGVPLAICSHVRVNIQGTTPPGFDVVTRKMSEKMSRSKRAGAHLDLGIPEFDTNFRVQGRAPRKVKQMLSEEEVMTLLSRANQLCDYVHITSKTLVLEHVGVAAEKLAEMFELAARLGEAIGDSYERPYQRLAKSLGLVLVGSGQEDRILRGRTREVRIMIRSGISRRNGQTFSTQIRAGIESGLPASLRVVPRESKHAGQSEIQIHDAEFAQMVFIRGVKSQYMDSLLRFPEIRTALIELFRTSDKTTIEMGEIILEWNDILGNELSESIEKVVTMVHLVRKAHKKMQGVSQSVAKQPAELRVGEDRTS